MKYYYYLLITNALVNVVAYVPSILMEYKTDGAVQSMLLAVPLSLFFLYYFTTTMFKFPGQDLASIFKTYLPKWINCIYFFSVIGLWFAAGAAIILSFSFITKRFLNPDLDFGVIVFLFSFLIGMCAILPSKKVLYGIEMILLINMPFIIILFIKAYMSKELNVEAMKIPFTYISEMPNYKAISASFYTFSGYVNIMLFNRVFTHKHRLKKRAVFIIGVLGVVNLFTTFLVPIGVQGIDAVQDYVYPWVVTADSLRMEFAFIERVLYVFLVLYIAVSIIASVVNWHVSSELCKSFIKIPALRWKQKKLDVNPYIFVLVFIVITHLIQGHINEQELLTYIGWYLCTLIPASILTVILMWWAKRRAFS